MMRRITLSLLAATAMGVIASHGASAADMAVKAAPQPPPPPPLWNWSGVYFGGNFGFGVTRQEFGSPNSGIFEGEGTGFGATGTSALGSHTGVGPLGGFQLGWNWQAPNSPYVWGIEGMFDFADLRGEHSKAFSASSAFFGGLGPSDTVTLTQVNFNPTFSSKVKDIAMITGRFGLTSGPQDRTLWYVKGGVAWAKTSYQLTANGTATFSTVDLVDNFADAGAVNAVGSVSGNSSRWGWTVGTGVEWGLWDNWSARIEYDFLGFGSHDISLNGTACFSGTSGSFCDAAGPRVSVKEQIHMVTVGLNYRFNWGSGGYWGH
jgi:opacity protein-like surface antigen